MNSRQASSIVIFAIFSMNLKLFYEISLGHLYLWLIFDLIVAIEVICLNVTLTSVSAIIVVPCSITCPLLKSNFFHLRDKHSG